MTGPVKARAAGARTAAGTMQYTLGPLDSGAE